MSIKSIALIITLLLLLVINILMVAQKGFSFLNLMAIVLCGIIFALLVVDWKRGKDE